MQAVAQRGGGLEPRKTTRKQIANSVEEFRFVEYNGKQLEKAPLGFRTTSEARPKVLTPSGEIECSILRLCSGPPALVKCQGGLLFSDIQRYAPLRIRHARKTD